MEASSPLSSGQRVLRNTETYVVKIGGENAANLRTNADRVRARTEQGKKQILVISALRSSDPAFTRFAHPSVDFDSEGKSKDGFNTTSHLIAMAERLVAGDQKNAHDLLERVRRATKEMVRCEIERDEKIDQAEMLAVLFATIDCLLDNACEQIFGTDKKPVAVGKDWLLHTEHESLSLTGIGEYLAQAIYHTYFQMRHLSVGQLDTVESARLMRGGTPKELLEQKQVSEFVKCIRNSVHSHVSSLLRMNDVVVAGGYLPVLGSQRGYSDKTGALIAQALQECGHNVAYLIEKQSAITSVDPNKNFPGMRIVPEMTYELAMEAFGDQQGADGKAVNPGAVQMVADYKIPTVVFNPQDESRITHIHSFEPAPNGMDIVASRKMPISIRVQSIKMRGLAGFVDTITHWLKERKISIDQIVTSEVAISFTFTNGDTKDGNTEQMDEQKAGELERFLKETFGDASSDLKLTHTMNKTLLFCMGNNMQQTGVARDATAALADAGANIHLMMQANQQVMTFMVDNDKALCALRRLHEVCIERKSRIGSGKEQSEK